MGFVGKGRGGGTSRQDGSNGEKKENKENLKPGEKISADEIRKFVANFLNLRVQ